MTVCAFQKDFGVHIMVIIVMIIGLWMLSWLLFLLFLIVAWLSLSSWLASSLSLSLSSPQMIMLLVRFTHGYEIPWHGDIITWKFFFRITGPLCMRRANERRRYIVTSSPVGWAHAQNYPSLRDHFVHAPGQWETTLHCSVVSRWLGA